MEKPSEPVLYIALTSDNSSILISNASHSVRRLRFKQCGYNAPQGLRQSSKLSVSNGSSKVPNCAFPSMTKLHKLHGFSITLTRVFQQNEQSRRAFRHFSSPFSTTCPLFPDFFLWTLTVPQSPCSRQLQRFRPFSGKGRRHFSSTMVTPLSPSPNTPRRKLLTLGWCFKCCCTALRRAPVPLPWMTVTWPWLAMTQLSRN